MTATSADLLNDANNVVITKGNLSDFESSLSNTFESQSSASSRYSNLSDSIYDVDSKVDRYQGYNEDNISTLNQNKLSKNEMVFEFDPDTLENVGYLEGEYILYNGRIYRVTAEWYGGTRQWDTSKVSLISNIGYDIGQLRRTVNNLSENASNNEPKNVEQCNLLAKNPSKKSVKKQNADEKNATVPPKL